jgi:uncharacterized membrane protein
MAKDLQEGIRVMLHRAIDEAHTSLTSDRDGAAGGGPLSGMRGVAAGAGALALAPVAVKGFGKLARTLGAARAVGTIARTPGKAVGGMTSKLGDAVGSGLGEKVSDTLDASGGPAHILTDALKGALPTAGGLPSLGGFSLGGGGFSLGGLFRGGEDDDEEDAGVPGIGNGRRMPIQEGVNIGVPLETVYNQWTQFEEWPKFMHRVTRVTQEDDCTVSFVTKIWGKSKKFTAEIETQRPDQRIKWHVSDGITHHGVATFHELAPNLTRVEVGLDVEPGGMLEKLARGLRHIRRAARGDLHRFKAFIEMREQETGAWRGVIEDGEVIEEHDPNYDEKRDYGAEQNAGGRSSSSSGRGPRSPSSSSGKSTSRRSASRSSQNGSSTNGSSGNGSSAQGKSRSSSSSRRSAGHSNGRGSSSSRRR